MARKFYIALPVLLLIQILFLGCSFLAYFNQPLTPRERIVADIWPILNRIQKKEIRQLRSYEEVRTFVDKFWEDRDPTPDTGFNEYKAEYEARLEYVHIHYRYKRGWTHSDRARIYLVYGPPDDIYYKPYIIKRYSTTPEAYALEIWVYNVYIANQHFPTIFDETDANLMKFAFADFSGVGRYTQIYSNVPGETIDPNVYTDPEVGELLMIEW